LTIAAAKTTMKAGSRQAESNRTPDG
jgi:hypothetical protein